MANSAFILRNLGAVNAVSSANAARQLASIGKQTLKVLGTVKGAYDAGSAFFPKKRARANSAGESVRAKSAQATGGGDGAGYVGRFRNRKGGKRRPSKRRSKRPAKRRSKRVVKGENFYARRGAIATLEVSGSISDSHCAYLGHASFAVGQAIEMCSIAIARRIFKEGIGYEADNLKSVIPYRTSGADQFSDGGTLIVKKVNIDSGVKSTVAYIIPPNATLTDVGGWLSLNVMQYISAQAGVGTGDTPPVDRSTRWLWIQLVDIPTGHTRTHIDLTTMMVDLYSRSELKIQNVTIPATGATETDNVANVPLIGRHYEMSHWQPVTSDDDMVVLNRLNQDTGVLGVEIKPTSGSLPQQYETWREPPPSKAFLNCKRSSKLHLEPGTIKNHISSLRSSMSLERFLQAIHIRRNNTSNRSVSIGRFDLFAFERMIQLAGDLPLKINYECNYFTGVAVTHRNRTAIMQKVSDVSQVATWIPT